MAHEWRINNGVMPLEIKDHSTKVEVMYRNGVTFIDNSMHDQYYWTLVGDGHDIYQWRPAEVAQS